MRVALLTNILPPYRVPFFNALARRCDLHVVFDALSSPDRQWRGMERDVRFAYTIAGGWRAATARPGVGYAAEQRYVEASQRTFTTLRSLAPDAIVSLELGARTLQAAAYARLARVPVICYWEGTPHSEARIGRARRWLRPWLARRMDAFWVNGIEATRYIRSLDVRAPLYPDMTGVDTHFFRDACLVARGERSAQRAALGLADTVLVTSASLSDRKGVLPYLEALSLLVARLPQARFSLLFIGEGEHRGAIERWAAAHPRIPTVVTGFVQIEALPRYYACGDWFVLPTLEDVWGLASIEAIAAGLPQIYSPFAGATADLSLYRDSGLVADPSDREAFAATLARVVEGRALPRLSEATIAAVVQRYSPEAQAERAHASLVAISASRARSRPQHASTPP